MNFLDQLGAWCTLFAGKIIAAVLVFIIGKIVIGLLLKAFDKIKLLNNLNESTKTFLRSLFKVILYVVLVLSVISILGVPMASIVALLATAGVTIGAALQGSLSNIAGGIMLMALRPFEVGDFVETNGVSGNVTKIGLFYTTLLTLDNKKVILPNGSLMDSTVTNYSSEENRRVDLTFTCAKSEDVEKVKSIMVKAMENNELVLKDPSCFAGVIGGTNEAMEWTVRAWCKSENYWDVYLGLTDQIVKDLGAAGVKAPAVRIVND